MFVKIPNVPCKQAICMTRHCKLYSGEIIEFQNFTIAKRGAISFTVLHCLFLFGCTPTFILYHQHSARWSGLFNYFLLCRILGGGVENFFGGVDILFEGVIANIGRVAPPCPPPTKSVYGDKIIHLF